ncbi:MAG TPA: hypothetical protein DD979_18370 [Gammaproteobacteria bacterium]|nr:hypothetical protein [Gammaproteobacteria bacterium]
MTSRIMLVEPSATMRYVLKNYTDASGYETDGFTQFGKALNALQRQFEVFDTEYRCVLIGWPSVRDGETENFLQLLESPDFHDLPVIVLSQDMRADARAWVAGRNNTVLVRWKEYRSVKELLARQLDADHEPDGDAFQAKFSNQDIRILVVDDSPSIRYALRDLLRLQGYDVTVVGSYSQGIQATHDQAFDIAVLDYYLQDATGDELCREIISDPAAGEVTCAILTGTYSDHIIKRSLRAGAVECMFKNESSELLLARIDAISRMVRQRKELQLNYLKMDVVIEALNGAVLSCDNEGILRFANSRALQVLGYGQDDEFIGHHVNEVLTQDHLVPVTDADVDASFYNARRQPMRVRYSSQDLIEDGQKAGTIVQFVSLEPPQLPQEAPPASNAAEPSERHEALLSASQYVAQMQSLLERSGQVADGYSVLLISVDVHAQDASVASIGDKPVFLEGVLNTLARVYKRRDAIACLGNGVIGVLLKHKSEKQAYLLTRKLLQIVNAVARSVPDTRFSSNGCLKQLSPDGDVDAPQLLRKTVQGLQIVKKRGKNLALILDMKRLLPVYPKEKSGN